MDIPIDATCVGVTYSTGLIHRGTTTALKNVSFTLHSGEILAVVGPSGAGKTTLINAIRGCLPAIRGVIFRFGKESIPSNWGEMTGFAAERPMFSQRGTGRSILLARRRRGGNSSRGTEEDIARVLEIFRLTAHAGLPCWSYSHGISVRLSLALAFVHRPKLILLDSPTNGLDGGGRDCLRHAMVSAQTEGSAILVTSCDCSDVESIADQMIVLNNGVVTARGTPRDLFPPDSSFTVQVNRDPHLSPGWHFVSNGRGWFSMVSGRSQLDQLLRALSYRGITPATVAPARGTALDISL